MRDASRLLPAQGRGEAPPTRHTDTPILLAPGRPSQQHPDRPVGPSGLPLTRPGAPSRAQRCGHGLGERAGLRAGMFAASVNRSFLSAWGAGGGSCLQLCYVLKKKGKKFGSQTTNCFAFGVTGINRHFLFGFWPAEAWAGWAGSRERG